MKSQSAEITLGEFLFQSDAKIVGLENAIKSETCEKCNNNSKKILLIVFNCFLLLLLAWQAIVRYLI